MGVLRMQNVDDQWEPCRTIFDMMVHARLKGHGLTFCKKDAGPISKPPVPLEACPECKRHVDALRLRTPRRTM
jgi:hypothetical protein